LRSCFTTTIRGNPYGILRTDIVCFCLCNFYLVCLFRYHFNIYRNETDERLNMFVHFVCTGLPRTSLLGLTSNRSKDTSSIPSSSQSSIGSISSSLTHGVQAEVKSHSCNRSRVNSVLHLFGPWLFEAALISDSTKQGKKYFHPNIFVFRVNTLF